MNNGTKIHQWSFHNGNSQKWQFVLRDDGYYVIYSRNSSAYYYLGISGNSTENGASVVLRTAPVTGESGLLWKISSASKNAYKIMAKSGNSNNRVLAAAQKSSTTGVALQQKNYTNDTNYVDEWYLNLQSTGITLEAQEQSEWCWAACARMLVKRFMQEVPISQASLAAYIHLGIITDNPSGEQIAQANEGATLSETKRAADYIIGWDKYYYANNKRYSEDTLRSLLDINNPVAISRSVLSSDGTLKDPHLVVIYDYEWNAQRNEYLYKIYDPDYNVGGRSYEKSYNAICNGQAGRPGLGEQDNRIWSGLLIYKEGNYTNTIG